MAAGPQAPVAHRGACTAPNRLQGQGILLPLHPLRSPSAVPPHPLRTPLRHPLRICKICNLTRRQTQTIGGIPHRG
eukprot:1196115-Prorocentrum_minimum.AAC.1